MTLRIYGMVVLLLHLTSIPIFSAEHRVASAAEIDALKGMLEPGDIVLLKNGEWKDQVLSFHGKGTKGKPITFKAESPGMCVLTGASSVLIDGEHTIVSGLHLKNGALK